MLEKVKNIIEICVSPYGLLCISIMLLMVGRFVFKRKYLNCLDILKKHLECFRKSNGKYSRVSIVLYYVVPFLLSLSLVQIKVLDDSIVNILTIIISILTSMLFTLLTLILDMRKRIKTDDDYNANEADISAKLLKETYYSMMFEILVCIVILIMCFIELFSEEYTMWASIVIYYLTFVLLMNLFMVLKRVFNVIDNDIVVQDRQN